MQTSICLPIIRNCLPVEVSLSMLYKCIFTTISLITNIPAKLNIVLVYYLSSPITWKTNSFEV
uniref:Uncharacterized protein n=1 Tax=Lepeophtheirus salmonis TaxID=72036 RepID=A0A0K2VH04_LEPSM